MTEATIEKPLCANCGVDVRDGTAFCYNCGRAVTAPPDELRVKEDVSPNGTVDKTISKAATERRKARVNQTRALTYKWEPDEDLALPLIAAIVLAVGVLLLVILLVIVR